MKKRVSKLTSSHHTKKSLSQEDSYSQSSLDTQTTVDCCSKEFLARDDLPQHEQDVVVDGKDQEAVAPVSCALLQVTAHDKSLETAVEEQSSVVRFDTVEIIEFPIQVGVDKVPTSGGPPLGMGFVEQFKLVLDLEEYEEGRPSRPRQKDEMAVPHSQRSAL